MKAKVILGQKVACLRLSVNGDDHWKMWQAMSGISNEQDTGEKKREQESL